MMKTLVILCALLFSTSSFAGWDEAIAAFEAGDFKTALREYKVLAEQGVDRAQFNLASMYRNGQGTTQDYKAAIKWFTKAAEQDIDRAQFSLGSMYHNGQGTIQDYTAAIKWFTRAAEQGDFRAQYNLGSMYHNGEGTLQDYARAHAWFNMAASNGDTNAQNARKLVEGKMTTSDISKAQALARECVAQDYKGC